MCGLQVFTEYPCRDVPGERPEGQRRLLPSRATGTLRNVLDGTAQNVCAGRLDNWAVVKHIFLFL